MRRFLSALLCACLGLALPPRAWAAVVRAVAAPGGSGVRPVTVMPAGPGGGSAASAGLASVSLGTSLPSPSPVGASIGGSGAAVETVRPAAVPGAALSAPWAGTAASSLIRTALPAAAGAAPEARPEGEPREAPPSGRPAVLPLLQTAVRRAGISSKGAPAAPSAFGPKGIFKALFDGSIGPHGLLPAVPGARRPALSRAVGLRPASVSAPGPAPAAAFLPGKKRGAASRGPSFALPTFPLWTLFPLMYLFNLGVLRGIAWAAASLEPTQVLSAFFFTIIGLVAGMLISLVKRWNAIPFVLLPVFMALLMSIFAGAHGSPYLWAAALTFAGGIQLHRTLGETISPLSWKQRLKFRSLIPDLSAYPGEESRRYLKIWSKQLLGANKTRRRAMEAIAGYHEKEPSLWAHSKALVPLILTLATTVYDEATQVAAVRFLGQAAFTHDEAFKALETIVVSQPTQRRTFYDAHKYIREVREARENRSKEAAAVTALEKTLSRTKRDTRFHEALDLLQTAAEEEARLRSGPGTFPSRKRLAALTRYAEKLRDAVDGGDAEAVSIAHERLQRTLTRP